MSTTMNRNLMVSRLFGWGLVLLAAGCYLAPAHATVLTMDVRRETSPGSGIFNYVPLSTRLVNDPADNDFVEAAYGHRVTASDLATFQSVTSATPINFNNYYGSTGGATPNIGAVWDQSFAAFFTYNAGVWNKSLYKGNLNAGQLNLTLTPDAGFGVDITSYTVQHWDAGNYQTAGTWVVRATNSVGAILSSGNWSQPGGSSALNTIAINYSGAVGQTLYFQFNISADADNANLAFDNFQFGQFAEAVPEPGTLTLSLFGLTAFMAMRRKRAVVLRALSARNGKVASIASLGLALVIFGGSITPAHATRLTMDVRNGSDAYLSNAGMVTAHSTYGSNVTATSQASGSFIYHYGLESGATPQITTAWLPSATSDEPKTYNDGNWPTVVWVNILPNNFFIAFTPNPGFAVKLESFTVDNYTVGTSPTQSGGWTVHDTLKTGPSLTSGLWSSASIAHDTIPRIINYTGNAGQTLVLEIFQNSTAPNSNGQMGYDNVIFSQVAVPEPNSFVMLLLGMGAVLKIRRRRTV